MIIFYLSGTDEIKPVIFDHDYVSIELQTKWKIYFSDFYSFVFLVYDAIGSFYLISDVFMSHFFPVKLIQKNKE